MSILWTLARYLGSAIKTVLYMHVTQSFTYHYIFSVPSVARLEVRFSSEEKKSLAWGSIPCFFFHRYIVFPEYFNARLLRVASCTFHIGVFCLLTRLFCKTPIFFLPHSWPTPERGVNLLILFILATCHSPLAASAEWGAVGRKLLDGHAVGISK